MEILPVHTEDAPRLTEIAKAAKAYWGYPERWLERWEPSLTIDPGYIQTNRVFAASLKQELVGFYALTGTPPRLDLDQLWVYPDFIGQGYGKALFQDAVQKAILIGAQELEIEADPHAEGFYLHMGARRVGEYIYKLDGETRILPRLLVTFQQS